jgi:lipopolysaccharide transport system permease protein
VNDTDRSPDVLVIEAGRASSEYWRDLLRYRELFAVLAWRDISIRYKQTVLGVAWALLQPLAATLAFTIVFGRIAKLDSGGVPYPLLVMAGVLPWQFFATAVTNASASLVQNANLLSKVYFPRLISPASATITAYVDFFVAFLCLGLMMAWYGFLPPVSILWAPVLLLPAWMAAMGAGLLLAALNVHYRDFRYIVPFILQVGLFLSPVGYSTRALPDGWSLLAALNPMAAVIDAFRGAVLGTGSGLDPRAYGISFAVGAALLVIGFTTFRKLERSLADVA